MNGKMNECKLARFSCKSQSISNEYRNLFYKITPRYSWEATVTGGLQTGGFQTGKYNIEKSALYFIWKRGVSTLLKPNWNEKEAAVLKV